MHSKHLFWPLAALGLSLGVGACGKSNGGLPSTGGSSGSPGSSSGASSSSSGAIGSSSGGTDAGSKDGGSDGGPAAPLCDPNAHWASPTAVGGVTGAHWLASMTPDELTIAWMDSNTTEGPVYVADRASTSAAFGTPQTIAGTFAPSRVGLSSEGLTVIVTLSAGAGFGQVTRSTRTGAFSTTPDTAPFLMFQQTGQPGQGGGGPPPTFVVGDPVISPDGLFLYYTQRSPAYSGGGTIAESYRTNITAPWTSPRFLLDASLKPTNGMLKRPTGISGDNRALFYWDEGDNQAHVAYRDGVFDSPANLFTRGTLALGALRNVAPSASCTRIYFTDATSTALSFSTKQQ